MELERKQAPGPADNLNGTDFQNIDDRQRKVGKRKRFRKVLHDYSQKSSISGMNFITSTKYSVVRFIWTCLLMVAVAGLSFHLYFLFSTYLSYQKQSQIDMSFSTLAFPAVTVCNVNPVRKSKLTEASKDMERLADAINPDTMGGLVDTWVLTDDEDETPKAWNNSQPLGSQSGNKTKRRRTSAELEETAFFDDMGLNFVMEDPLEEDDQLDVPDFQDSWEAQSTESAMNTIKEDFAYLFTSESTKTRGDMGHQIKDMLIQCSYDGRKCLHKNFTRVYSETYGNCYTLEYDKFVARASGPQSGLELILYLQTTEYVSGLTNSKGVQVVVHEPGSVPFPDNDGFAVAAGTETAVGLKMMEISRLGEPFGSCNDQNTFKEKYKIKYSRQTCQAICEAEMVMSKCSCYNGQKVVLDNILQKSSTIKPCKKKKEMKCLRQTLWSFDTNSKACDCGNPCTETKYVKTISSRQWPDVKYADLIVKALCPKQSEEICEDLQKRNVFSKTQEFLKLTIFYEDLNYEKIQEEPSYQLTQFCSDLGGTIGLWIGLSLLSVFEIFHLIINLIVQLCCYSWKKGFAGQHKKDERYEASPY